MFSTLRANTTAVISPSFSNPIATIHLGHYAEQYGESDYVCVNTHAIGCLKGVKALLELERSRDACEKEPSRDIGLDLSAGTERIQDVIRTLN